MSINGIRNGDANSAPIGLFDSGVGGLTVLREVYRQLPQESVVYFGDTARLPYGAKTPDQILDYVREILGWMELRGCKMVIMACNTSSALALEAVRSEFSMPILGVILPGARAAVLRGKRVGVISTVATAQSNAYKQAIAEIDPSAQVWQVGCPEFVPLIEGNRVHSPETLAVAQRYLDPLLANQIDTLVYGCTHYPHLAPVLKKLLPSHVTLIDPAEHVITAASKELDILGLKHTHRPRPSIFAVSGDPLPFTQIASQWLGFTPVVQQVVLPELVRR
jgi:glutamate racemase